MRPYNLIKTSFPVLLALGLFFATSCKNKEQGVSSQDTTSSSGGRKMSNFQYLRQCMIGDFSSMQQAQMDSDYFDIRLRMVPIWEANEQAFYLYVEQAVASSISKPYRQRIYKVIKEDDNQFVSYIYTVARPERLTGKSSDDPIFKQLTADSLQLKDGCEVRLKYDVASLSFTGSTGDQTCPSDRSGASWATSKVSITETQMISWDQGWNSEGKQVWGAIKGGYIFVKQ
jgi:CpeT/CpcT family (DUF1001)